MNERQVQFFLSKSKDEVAEYRKEKGNRRGEKICLAADQKALAKILAAAGKKVSENAVIDVYNPSITFEHNGWKYIAGRVEFSAKAAEGESVVIFFRKENDNWVPLSKPVFRLQDPNITWLDDEMVLSGIQVVPGRKRDPLEYRTVFYKGIDFENLIKFAVGPWGMKGIRLSKLANGDIGVYTRPQEKKGELGQIGFTTVKSLADLAENKLAEIVERAPLLDYRFPRGEWGGVNQVIPLSGNQNLAIGHRAYRDGRKNRHYLSWAFVHDLETGRVADLGILAERSDFPAGRAKAPDLVDVVYTAGVVREGDGWFLIVGLSDTEAGVIEIDDPRKFPVSSFQTVIRQPV